MDAAQLALLLSEIPGVGDRAIAAVLEKNAVLRRAPEAVLGLGSEALVEEYGLRRDAAERIERITPTMVSASEAALRSLRRTGVNVVTFQEPLYPSRLLERLPHLPPVLHLYGSHDVLRGKTFTVANSNGAPEAALAAADAAAEEAIRAGWRLVTGHNRPAYQRPALVARRNGGRICFVLDRGLLEAFGGDLARDLFPAARIWSPTYDPECDLTISPFGPRAHGIAAHNRTRDALIFALADVILAGDVRSGGQMERRCLEALSAGRPVYMAGPEEGWSAALREAGALPLPSGWPLTD